MFALRTPVEQDKVASRLSGMCRVRLEFAVAPVAVSMRRSRSTFDHVRSNISPRLHPILIDSRISGFT